MEKYSRRILEYGVRRIGNLRDCGFESCKISKLTETYIEDKTTTDSKVKSDIGDGTPNTVVMREIL